MMKFSGNKFYYWFFSTVLPLTFILLPMQLYDHYNSWPRAEHILKEKWKENKVFCIGFSSSYEKVDGEYIFEEKERIYFLFPHSIIKFEAIIINETIIRGKMDLRIIKSPGTLFLNLLLFLGMVAFLRFKGIPTFIKFIRLQ
jgi:hypothetical protein